MINVSVVTGRLAEDPTLKKTTSGLSVLSFRLGVERWAGKDKEKQTDWINFVAWRQTADYLARYAGKGDLIAVKGSIQTRDYTNSENKRVYITEVLVEHAEIVAKSNRSTGGSNVAQSTYSNQTDDFSDFDTGVDLGITADSLPF